MTDRFESEGYPVELVEYEASVDIRYQGQYSDLRIPLHQSLDDGAVDELQRIFTREHQLLYGHGSDDPLEVVAVRLIGRYRPQVNRAGLKPYSLDIPSTESRRAFFGEPWGTVDTRVMSRGDLRGTVGGPLLIDEYDSTIVVPPDMTAILDDQNNVIMEKIDGQP